MIEVGGLTCMMKMKRGMGMRKVGMGMRKVKGEVGVGWDVR